MNKNRLQKLAGLLKEAEDFDLSDNPSPITSRESEERKASAYIKKLQDYYYENEEAGPYEYQENWEEEEFVLKNFKNYIDKLPDEKWLIWADFLLMVDFEDSYRDYIEELSLIHI